MSTFIGMVKKGGIRDGAVLTANNRKKPQRCCENGYVNKKCKFKECKKCCLEKHKGLGCSVHGNKLEIAPDKIEVKREAIRFRDVVELVESDVNKVMSVMQSSDFEVSYGLNEAGLKMLIIGTVARYLGYIDTSYFSEYPIPKDVSILESQSDPSERYYDPKRGSISINKFVDLYIETPVEIIVIEVKYVKLPLILGIDAEGDESRIELSNKKKRIASMKNEEILKKYRIKSNKLSKLEKEMEEANSVQLYGYLKLISRSELKKPLSGYLFFGFAERCVVIKSE